MNHCCFHLESLCDLEEEFTLIQWIFSLWCHQFHPCLLSKNFFVCLWGVFCSSASLGLFEFTYLETQLSASCVRSPTHVCTSTKNAGSVGVGGLLNNQDVEGFRLPPWSSSSSFKKKKIVFIYFHQPVHVPVVSQWGWRERVAPHTHRRTHIDAATSTQSPPQACGRGRRAERGGYGWGWWSEVG